MSDFYHDVQNLQQFVNIFLEARQDLQHVLDEFESQISHIKNKYKHDFEFTHILDDLDDILENINLHEGLSFIDEIESEMYDLPTKMKKASENYQMTINPVVSNLPIFYDTSKDFLKKNDEKDESIL